MAVKGNNKKIVELEYFSKTASKFVSNPLNFSPDILFTNHFFRLCFFHTAVNRQKYFRQGFELGGHDDQFVLS
jgi:hypothetical protein